MPRFWASGRCLSATGGSKSALRKPSAKSKSSDRMRSYSLTTQVSTCGWPKLSPRKFPRCDGSTTSVRRSGHGIRAGSGAWQRVWTLCFVYFHSRRSSSSALDCPQSAWGTPWWSSWKGIGSVSHGKRIWLRFSPGAERMKSREFFRSW